MQIHLMHISFRFGLSFEMISSSECPMSVFSKGVIIVGAISLSQFRKASFRDLGKLQGHVAAAVCNVITANCKNCTYKCLFAFK